MPRGREEKTVRRCNRGLIPTPSPPKMKIERKPGEATEEGEDLRRFRR